MTLVLQWAYPARSQISYMTGITMMLGLLLLANLKPVGPREMIPVEFTAYLDMPEAARAEMAEIKERIREEATSVPVPPKPQILPTKTAEQTLISKESAMPVGDGSLPALSEQPVQAASMGSQLPVQEGTSEPVAKSESAGAGQPNPARKNSYEGRLLAYLEQIKRYPSSREARLTRPQGEVRVWLEINRWGQLLAAGLLASSGSNLLDGEALRTIRSGAYPPMPETEYVGQTIHRFSATLKYTIE